MKTLTKKIKIRPWPQSVISNSSLFQLIFNPVKILRIRVSFRTSSGHTVLVFDIKTKATIKGNSKLFTLLSVGQICSYTIAKEIVDDLDCRISFISLTMCRDHAYFHFALRAARNDYILRDKPSQFCSFSMLTVRAFEKRDLLSRHSRPFFGQSPMTCLAPCFITFSVFTSLSFLLRKHRATKETILFIPHLDIVTLTLSFIPQRRWIRISREWDRCD
jgi:hypothetical protein